MNPFYHFQPSGETEKKKEREKRKKKGGQKEKEVHRSLKLVEGENEAAQCGLQ